MYNEGNISQDLESLSEIFPLFISNIDSFYNEKDSPVYSSTRKDSNSTGLIDIRESSEIPNKKDIDASEIIFIEGINQNEASLLGQKRSKNKNEEEKTDNAVEEKKDNFSIFDKLTNENLKELIDGISNKKMDKIKRRIDDADNIDIRLIRRFFKRLTNQLNKNLKYFKLNNLNRIPGIFIKEIISKIKKAKKMNNKNEVNFTLKEIYSTKFCQDEKKYRKLNIKNYEKNLNTINNLEHSKDIYINSSSYLEKRFSEIFKNYIYSEQFALDISNIKFKKEEDEKNEAFKRNYLERCIKNAICFINLFEKE